MKDYVQKILDGKDLDEVCKYCIYGHDCPGPVTSYGNGPVFAPCHDGNPEGWFDIEAYEEEELEMLAIVKVVYNNPATIVWFADGEKVVVKCHNEEFDKEKGVAMAIAAKLYTRSDFVRIVEGGTEQNPKAKVIKAIAKITEHMVGDASYIWIIKGKTYDLTQVINDGEDMYHFINEQEDEHYVPISDFDKYFKEEI